MKLFALIAAVSAEWNGVSNDNTCGMQISGDSMVNATCLISGVSIKSVFAGNGAFITGADTFTGFDGISGNVDAVVFFNQDCDDSGCDNSTCWNAAVNCVDNGYATDGVFFMESVNDDRAAAGNYNLQIAGVSAGDVLQINLNGWQATNITAPFGVVTGEGAIFAVEAGENFGDLFQVSVSSADENQGALNLWASSVSN